MQNDTIGQAAWEYADLLDALRVSRQAERDLDTATVYRDDQIRQAKASGYRVADLAAETGLSVQRIYQILARRA